MGNLRGFSTIALLMAAGLPSLAAAQPPTLMLRTAPGNPIAAAHMADSGAVFAVARVDGSNHVVYQSGANSNPNKVFAEGHLSSGPFQADKPITSIPGTDYTVIQTDGTGAGAWGIVINSNGGVLYRMSPANYPAAGGPVQLLDAFGIGMPLSVGKEGEKLPAGPEKFLIAFGFFLEDQERSILAGLFRNPVLSMDTTRPTIFSMPNPDTLNNLLKAKQRFVTLINLFDAPDEARLMISSAPLFQNTFTAGYAIRPLRFEYDPPPTGLQGTLVPPQRAVPTMLEAYGQGTNGMSTVVSTSQAMPLLEDRVVAVGMLDTGARAAYVAHAPEALGELSKSKPPVDCTKSDLNGDGKVDGADMDLMMGYVMTNDPKGDLTGDGVTNHEDISYLDRAIKECNKGIPTGPIAAVLLAEGEPLPGLPDYRISSLRHARGNGFGVAAIRARAATEQGFNLVRAIVMMDDVGFQTVLRTGDDFGHGRIVEITDSSVRSGLSEINRHGQFAATARFADNSYGVYRFSGRNTTDPTAGQMEAATVVRGVVQLATPTLTLDVNGDGVVDAADTRAAINKN